MEVPDAVLDKLKCENCEHYLSRGPVLMVDDDRSRCGRCFEPEESAIRNKPYEELAKLLKFPCRYKEYGCEEKLRFEENKAHEEACMHKPYLCPIAESGKCDWSGGRGNLLEHCNLEHPGNVIENPVQFKHDITKLSLGNYLLFAFQILFLVQTKVCTVSRKIYHSVRLLGDSNLACNFTYDVEIANEHGKLIRHGHVLDQGCMMVQEDTSVTVDINSLLMVMEGLKNTIFTLSVRSVDGYVDEPNKKGKTIQSMIMNYGRKLRRSGTTKRIASDNTDMNGQVHCVKCKTVTEPVYRDDRGWKCRGCAPVRRVCKYRTKGCTYLDVPDKCAKYELYYCQYTEQCGICKKELKELDMCLDVHFRKAHANIIYRAGTVRSNILPSVTMQWFIIPAEQGNILCVFWMDNINFYLWLYTPLPSDQLYLHQCTVEISHPETKLTFSSTNDMQYNSFTDWQLCIRRTEFNTYLQNNKCNMRINVNKKESTS